jgi:DNA repair protein RadC
MKVDYLTIPEITVSFRDSVKTSERFRLSHPSDAAKILSEAYKDCMQHHEEVNVLYLNNSNRVMGILNVAKGGIDKVVVDIRIILQTALKVSASAILLSHNHPSSDIKPSNEDLALTQKVKTGCEAIGIKLIDHVIITDGAYCSFAEENLITC